MSNIEREDYKKTVGLVYSSILAKLRPTKEKEYKEFLQKMVEISELSLRSLLFKDFREVSFKKKISKNNIIFWLEKVSLALISYSYFSVVSVREWHNLDDLYIRNISYMTFFKTILKHYNFIFETEAKWEDIIYYGSSYKEIADKRKDDNSDDLKKFLEKDCRVLGAELLAGVWVEDIDSNQNSKEKSVFLSNWIRKTHKKLVIPLLEDITLRPKKNK